MTKKNKKKLVNHPSQPHKDIIFTIDKNDRIGAAGADEDIEFLEHCFVDAGYLRLLMDMADHRQIILGRTGAGKTALLNELVRKKHSHSINVLPENLALTYVSNSTILRYFSHELDVNLDPFFKLLWRHVFAIEILKRCFDDNGSTLTTGASIKNWIYSHFTGKNRENKELKEAVTYLEEWGSNFWDETEFRVKEITEKVESNLNSELSSDIGSDFARFEGSVAYSRGLSKEQKSQIRDRAQRIISQAQIQDLSKVIRLLDKVLSDKQKNYYLIIDGLDEDWVEDVFRYRLIKALIVTVREISKVTNVKAIVALRRDVLERVIRITRESGFQEEKYQSLYLPLTWSPSQLKEILNKRISKLMLDKTGRASVSALNILPKKFKKKDIFSYLTSRAERPRDIIALFNECMAIASGKSKISEDDIARGEGNYSRLRLRALADEWFADYPNLIKYSAILSNKTKSFKISSVNNEEIYNLCLKFATDKNIVNDNLNMTAVDFINEKINAHNCLAGIIYVFYKIGLVGLKTTSHESESWVDVYGRGISLADIGSETSVVVHPAYHRALGILNRL